MPKQACLQWGFRSLCPCQHIPFATARLLVDTVRVCRPQAVPVSLPHAMSWCHNVQHVPARCSQRLICLPFGYLLIGSCYWLTGDLEVSKIIVEQTKLFKVTVSFGNVISLISLPCFMSHASIPAAVRAARGLPDDLVRISAGIEDIGDLIADLQQAMDLALADKQRRGQQAEPASGSNSSNSNGAGALVAAAATVDSSTASSDVLLAAAVHSREHELLQRIQRLESQIAAQNGQPTRL